MRSIRADHSAKRKAPLSLSGNTGPSLQAACKPNFVEDGHSSRRRIAAALKRPTRRFPLHAMADAIRMEDPRWRAGQARRAAIWAWPRIPPYLVLLRVGFTLPPNVAAGAVRSYRTFSPLPCALRRRRYLLCGTSRLAALKLRSRTLSGTLPCGVRTFLSRSCDQQRPPGCPLVSMVTQESGAVC
jgi:hypothetical protein